jgi:murein DD-endopeptidase MepM/ murein hydrolase activator NlpD
VHQGDLVGRVGSTGLATGPHLHYQLTVNGKYADPMKTLLPMASQEVPASERPAFDKLKAEMIALLGATP